MTQTKAKTCNTVDNGVDDDNDDDDDAVDNADDVENTDAFTLAEYPDND